MNATEALRSAQAAGVEIRLDGDDLVLTASDQPPAAVLDGLRRHKADLVALLRADRCGWSVEDWRTYFAERAGIAAFDAGLSRTDAEARAFDCALPNG